jgi:hypothetical protein
MDCASGPADAGRFLAAGESLGRFSKADFPHDDWWKALGDRNSMR